MNFFSLPSTISSLNATKSQEDVDMLTSHRYDRHRQLENTVDEGEGKHDLQLFRAEGQLDDGAAQLGVLETRLQRDGSAPDSTQRLDKTSVVDGETQPPTGGERQK